MLVVVLAQFEVDWSKPEWIEDELVRSGARDAHMLADDIPTVAVTVCARSRDGAETIVRSLLEHVGASSIEIVPARVAVAH